MNKTLQDIFSRRSIRSYKETQLADNEIEQILEAGLAAPSSLNRQPWHFTVIQDKELLDRLVQRNKEIVLASPELMKICPWVNVPNYNNFYHAPTVIIISGEAQNHSHVCDCSLAMENMSLAAWTLSIGSVIVASTRFVLKEPEFLEILGLPQGYVPLYALGLGYIKGDIPNAPKRKEGSLVKYIR